MKKVLFAGIVVLLIAACSLPQGVWTFDTRLAEPTVWEGGPPMETEEALATATSIALATEEAPQEESTPIPPECLVKGNVSSSGEKIYHVEGGVYYDRVVVDESQGDAWYCSPEDAEAAGFRSSLR